VLDLLYFAWVRERIGRDGERIVRPDDVTDVASLLGWLAGQSPAHADALADRQRIRVAIDQSFVGLDAEVPPIAEIAIFPPVTGG
jgi:molybdopterin synthase sulfur carrier subunit